MSTRNVCFGSKIRKLGIPLQTPVFIYKTWSLTHLSLASFLWDIGKQNSPRCDAAERGVPSGAILFASRNFIEKLDKK